MSKKVERIEIIYSDELIKMRLKKLIGRTGCVIEEVIGKNNNIIGAFIQLDIPHKEEKEWFIPIKSIMILSNGKTKT